MPFIRTISPEDATGTLKELYEDDRTAGSPRVRVIEAWSLRPEVLAARNNPTAAIAAHMDLRRYELVTLVAASRVKCSV